MNYTKLGVHITQGSRNGYGLVVAQNPAAVTIVDELGATDELLPETIAILRVTSTPNHADVPGDFDQLRLDQMEAAAAYWYPKVIERVRPYLGRKNTYFQPINETGGNDEAAIQKIIAYQLAWLELAKADGYKLAVGSLAGGNPHWQLWVKYFVPFLNVASRYNALYSRHAYGGVPVGQPLNLTVDGKAVTDNTKRPFLEAQYLRERDINIPIVITEAGQNGGLGFIGSNSLIVDYAAYDKLCLEHINIWGFCGWTYGKWGNSNSNIESASSLLATYLSEREIAPREEIVIPEKHKAIVVKLPQDMTESEWLKAADIAYSFRHTMTASHDDMMSILRSGNEYSYVKFSHRERDMESLEMVENAGYDWETLYSLSPLDGLKLGKILSIPYMYTSLFNSPRSYGNHEGIDADVLEAGDSKASVLCTYDGIVDRIAISTTGYGKQVVVLHNRNGKPFYTRYAHLDNIYVVKGQLVKQGTPVGEIGATGNVTGEHLHFNLEVPSYGLSGYVVPDVVDPKPYLPDLTTPPALIDLLPYLKGDGRLYEVKNANGGQERFQTQQEGAYFYQTKNSQWEQLFFGNDFIYRGKDTSPGGDRYYQLIESSQLMARWIPRHWSTGANFANQYRVQFYNKSDCSESSANSGDVSNTMRFNARYTAYTFRTGIVLSDVIELEWVNGGEKYLYARGYGLVGWERVHQDTNTPQWSAISEIHEVGTRPDNIREKGCFS